MHLQCFVNHFLLFEEFFIIFENFWAGCTIKSLVLVFLLHVVHFRMGLNVRLQNIFVCKWFWANIAKCSVNRIIFVILILHLQMLLGMCLHPLLAFEMFPTLFTGIYCSKSLRISCRQICGILPHIILNSNVVIVVDIAYALYLDVPLMLDTFLCLILNISR